MCYTIQSIELHREMYHHVNKDTLNLMEKAWNKDKGIRAGKATDFNGIIPFKFKFNFQLFHFLSDPLLMSWGKQQKMDQVFRFLAPSQGICMKLLASNFSLTQPQMLQSSEKSTNR